MRLSHRVRVFNIQEVQLSWSNSDRRAGLPADWHIRRKRILRRDDGSCQIRGPRCTQVATDVDHIQRGDNHEDRNLQAVCRPCHTQKTARESADRKRQLRAAGKRPQERHPGAR
ncbi:HNH endonuclease [Mycobacterium kyogaense]|uniref:HNH endonuclease n=1 Tax=Mycobacterium kyogaense TaxID=2212479 RepID=UPI00196948F3|nr:HNH endonuclease signature motif containing protein [Mycobacterium kyogaense]